MLGVSPLSFQTKRPPQACTLVGQFGPAEHVAEVVGVVDGPVAHLAVAPVPLPVPVVVELLAHRRVVGGRSAPEVVVDALGNRAWVGRRGRSARAG